MLLVNLPPHLRSNTDNIKLVLLCHEKYVVTRFHWHEMLRVLIQDLQIFETQGINIIYPEGVINFKGTVIAVLGDNLGSHQIGGFTQNFSTVQNFCRY